MSIVILKFRELIYRNRGLDMICRSIWAAGLNLLTPILNTAYGLSHLILTIFIGEYIIITIIKFVLI